MNLGFIGTGKIASSVITGICTSKISYRKIIISPRNIKIAKGLKAKFKKITIAKTNQQIVDQSDWVFLSVTPSVGQKIIKDLKFKTKQTVISFISTITLSQLKKAIKVKAKIVRAIPLPPISFKKAIDELEEEDQSFSLSGASWTNDLSWEDGYINVLEPIAKLSSYFHETFDHLLVQNPLLTKTHDYQEALLYLLLLETSCFRYWGQGTWTEYANTIFRKGEEVIRNFKISEQSN